ncbi:MAG TPA: NTP transferase domain-containing protein [Vicinamibacteria bacterium]|nr:NTP transferase domain-containing protein [Vicinamibacteria bacterium]
MKVPRIEAIVLAAGRGERMGGPKALLAVEGETFLARLARRLRRPGVAGVVAVLGHQAARVARESGLPPGVEVVVNARYMDGMLTSILAGLDAAEAAGAGAVLLHPVDHPLVEPETIDRVVAALREGAPIAVPSHGGRRGHPGGFARATWDALRAAPAERGARAVLGQHPEWVRHVEGGPGCRAGVNTPEDYRRLIGD